MGDGPCSKYLLSLSGQAQLLSFPARMEVQLQNAVMGRRLGGCCGCLNVECVIELSFNISDMLPISQGKRKKIVPSHRVFALGELSRKEKLKLEYHKAEVLGQKFGVMALAGGSWVAFVGSRCKPRLRHSSQPEGT